ncbi:MAG: hypothetical protein ACI4A5_02665 [Hominilimicola sp.]
MQDTYKSNSLEQQEAGHILFMAVQKWLNTELLETPKISLADNTFTYMQPDFYSESASVVGEIFTHIGKPKKAQDNKIANDILKMLLLEKIRCKKYRKIIVVCDESEENKLKGTSVLAECIRQFDIEIKKIDIDTEIQNKIIKAQERQKMINA